MDSSAAIGDQHWAISYRSACLVASSMIASFGENAQSPHLLHHK